MDIDKWTAEQCNIKYYENGDSLFYGDDDAVEAMNNGEIVVLDRADVCRGLYIWTMQDARCREIVREHFKIETMPSCDGDFTAATIEHINMDERWLHNNGSGKSIEAAEIACITAIMNSEE